MAFYEVQFPQNITYGSSGGGSFLTHIVSTDAGWEYRSGQWARKRAKWNVAHGLKQPIDYKALISFFYSVGQGKLNGFRLKDWLDYKDWGSGVILSNAKGHLQLAKVYTSPAPIVSGATQPTYTRFIDKPVPATLTLPGGVTVDYTTGLTTGATSGQTWTGQFDTPARFDTDELDMSLDQPWGANGADVAPSWREIPIVELLIAPQ